MRKFCKILGLTAGVGLLFLCAVPISLLAQTQQQQPPPSTVPRVQAVQEKAAESPPTPGSEAPTAPRNDYVIGPEDVLRIDVFQVPELSNLTVRVSNNGTITVPLLGRVEASGMTTNQLAESLADQWGKSYLQHPQVTVTVSQFQAKPVSIVGAVEKPGLYYLTGPRSLIEMLSMAGGLAKKTSGPAGPTVYVTRPAGFGDLQSVSGMHLVSPDKVAIDIRKLLYSNATALNISIKPSDIISVNKADVVYVTGRGVTRPGGFILEDRDSVTVFQALALAEGLSAEAAKHDARIIRQGKDGKRIEIPVDLDKVLKGKAPDPVLAANDILFVPDSRQKVALKRAIDTTMATVSGLLIWGKI